jgi:hypothetical protein
VERLDTNQLNTSVTLKSSETCDGIKSEDMSSAKHRVNVGDEEAREENVYSNATIININGIIREVIDETIGKIEDEHSRGDDEIGLKPQKPVEAIQCSSPQSKLNMLFYARRAKDYALFTDLQDQNRLRIFESNFMAWPHNSDEVKVEKTQASIASDNTACIEVKTEPTSVSSSTRIEDQTYFLTTKSSLSANRDKVTKVIIRKKKKLKSMWLMLGEKYSEVQAKWTKHIDEIERKYHVQ